MNRRLADIVTAHALRHGLAGGPGSDAAGRELVELAQADRRVLELALARIERGLTDRSSPVGERARDALERAIALVAIGPTVAVDLATVVAGSAMANGIRWAAPDG